MFMEHPRIKRERKTVEAMIKIYCKIKHNSKSTLCKDCQALFNYAIKRLKKCPFQGDKPICAQCTIHCYREPERSTMKKVMSFSGPRMLFSHPILVIYHFIDKSKNKPK